MSGELGPEWFRGEQRGGGQLAEDEEEIWLNEAIKRAEAEYGKADAKWVYDMFQRCPPKVPYKRAWAWALDKYAVMDCARMAGTGYDPDEEFRVLNYGEGK